MALLRRLPRLLARLAGLDVGGLLARLDGRDDGGVRRLPLLLEVRAASVVLRAASVAAWPAVSPARCTASAPLFAAASTVAYFFLRTSRHLHRATRRP